MKTQCSLPRMSQITLYMMPRTCSRATCIVLEETGADFDTVPVRLPSLEQKSSEFKAINPKGRVPALVVDGDVLTENVAIINYLAKRFPSAGLIPDSDDPLQQAKYLADLCFCATTVHPMLPRLVFPEKFAPVEFAGEISARAAIHLTEYFELIENRLAEGAWWYGDKWSAMDAYLFWVYGRVDSTPLDVSPFTNYAAHTARMLERPAVERTMEREAKYLEQLKAEGAIPSI